MLSMNYYHQNHQSRQHHQELLREAERERLVQQAEQYRNQVPTADQRQTSGMAHLLKLAGNPR